MLWTAEAVEDLKKLALEGKSASHIAAALGVGSRNAVIGKASRIGIKLNGGGGAAGARQGAGPRGSAPMGDGRYPRPNAGDQAPGAARRSRSPGLAGGRRGGVELWRSRDRRDATAAVRGHSRIRLPVAARRSEKRRFRLLRAHAGRRASPIAPAIAEWLIGRRRRGRSRGSDKGSAPSRVHGGCREAAREAYAPTARRPLEHADQTRSVRARFAPRRSRLHEERPQAGLARRRLDIGPAVRKPHRRLEFESVALASFDREREQAIRGQRPRDSGEQRREVADIDERVRGDDEIEDPGGSRSSIAAASPTTSRS